MKRRIGVRGWNLLAALVIFGAGLGLASPQTGVAQQTTVAEKVAASRDLLDINTATAAQLAALPGMGAAYAQRVIAGRPYTAKNLLTKRGILPESAYQRIKGLIIAHRPKQ